MAKVFNMSESTFKRKFKKLFLRPVHLYVHSKQVEAAREMIAQGRLSLSEVAKKVGYKNASILTKQLEKYPSLLLLVTITEALAG